MEPALIATVIVAVVGALGGYATANRTTKPATIAAASSTASALLASYDAFADRLQQEVDRVRRDCEQRLVALERQHDTERVEWREERDRLNERIDELGTQLYVLQNVPPTTRS